MNERVQVLGHYLIVTSSGYGTRATVACPECGLRWSGTDDVRPDGVAYEGVRRPPAGPPSDACRAWVIAGRSLAGLPDPSCEGVRHHRLAAEVMES